jgi:hypothetical protein
MRLFVAIRVKNGVPSEDRSVLKGAVRDVMSALDKVQPWPAEATTEDLRWAPEGGRVALLFRSNETATTVERSGWIGNKTRAWAWSGVVGSGLHGALRDGSCATVPDAVIWSGIGSYGLIGATPDTISTSTNQHRSEGLYWTVTDDCVIFSNSAATLSLVRTGDLPSYNRIGIAGFLIHGLPFTDTVPFEGVRVVPAGATVESGPRSDLRVRVDEPERSADVGIEDIAGDIAEGLTEYARVLTSGAGEVAAAITGGKDSRLVVAALHAAGVPFSTYTNGLPESGEIVIGRRVCQALGVRHRANAPAVRRGAAGGTVVEGRPEEQAWATLKSTGGMGNAFTALPSPLQPHVSIAGKANLGGQGGEIVRGGFARYLESDNPTPTEAEALLRSTWFNNRDLLTPLAAEAVELDVRNILDATQAEPARTLFDAYVTNRTGRWLATMRHGESVVNTHATLLINNRMVRQMRTLPTSALLGERVAHAVIGRLAPAVVDIPFFRDRWAFEATGPVATYKPESWAERAPYTAHDQPRATFNWRTAFTPALSGFFREYILSSPTSLLFDVVDRQAVESMLKGVRYRPPAAWALFSVQYMLSNDWLGPKPTTVQTIEIEVPK